MDKAHGDLHWSLAETTGRDLWEARATVAELIEAASEVQEQFIALIKLHGEHTCWEMRDRLTAALARAGGEK